MVWVWLMLLVQAETMKSLFACLLVVSSTVFAQSPYGNLPEAKPPYYRVRYEASERAGELIFPVTYTVWVPAGVKTLRGVIVHQHGCGEGSCKSGQTGAYDLHWQALARKHGCALMSPSYEQPEKANCQMWCDPRNGSDAAYQRALKELGAASGHPEMAAVPWALWGHSGGGHWAGGMALLHPDRVAAAWLRSGVPMVRAVEGKPQPYEIPEAALKVPLMCNLGTKEGVTVKDGRFAGVWTGVETFFTEMRSRGALLGVSVDPLTSHECGNQRYLAIPWFDACLEARLPKAGARLEEMGAGTSWVAPLHAGAGEVTDAVEAKRFSGELKRSVWLPGEVVAKMWARYEKDTGIEDKTPPPAPRDVRVQGNEVTWDADADLESGLAGFVIERDGKFLANVPEQPKNPFGRPLFQNLQYSDTPSNPLVRMQFTDTKQESGRQHRYRVIAVNTAGLRSE